MSERTAVQDMVSAGLIARPNAVEDLGVLGVFHAECIRDGEVIWTDTFKNIVTTQGRNAMMDKFLDLGAAYAAIAMGLHTTVGNAASTYSTPSPQVESVVYSNGTRPVPSFSASSGAVKSTSAAVTFNINGSATITGAFIAIGAAGVTTKSDTAASAVLFSSGAFSGGSRAVISGDTLNVTYSLTMTSS